LPACRTEESSYRSTDTVHTHRNSLASSPSCVPTVCRPAAPTPPHRRRARPPSAGVQHRLLPPSSSSSTSSSGASSKGREGTPSRSRLPSSLPSRVLTGSGTCLRTALRFRIIHTTPCSSIPFSILITRLDSIHGLRFSNCLFRFMTTVSNFNNST